MTKRNQTTKTEPEAAKRWVIATEGEGMTEGKARSEAKKILNLHPDYKLYLCEVREEISMRAMEAAVNK